MKTTSTRDVNKIFEHLHTLSPTGRLFWQKTSNIIIQMFSQGRQSLVMLVMLVAVSSNTNYRKNNVLSGWITKIHSKAISCSAKTESMIIPQTLVRQRQLETLKNDDLIFVMGAGLNLQWLTWRAGGSVRPPPCGAPPHVEAGGRHHHSAPKSPTSSFLAGTSAGKNKQGFCTFCILIWNRQCVCECVLSSSFC